MNHAGTSPAPWSVTERVLQHLELEQNLGGYAVAALVEDEVQQVYQSAAKLIHANPSQIALVESATVAWTPAFYSL
jgi:selenocysteine lyase/cysteine desulfurase